MTFTHLHGSFFVESGTITAQRTRIPRTIGIRNPSSPEKRIRNPESRIQYLEPRIHRLESRIQGTL